MKRLSILIIILGIASNFLSASNALSPQTQAPLFDHMMEINVQWAQFCEGLAGLEHPVSFQNDNSRIQKHLELVESILRQKEDVVLSCTQEENRMAMLDALKIYASEGEFPINTGHTYRIPYFIDDFGTACAVGHLLQTSGFGDFAEKIKEQSNFSYLLDMTYDEIPVWAEAFGFTSRELAWIQPAYWPQPLPWAAVGNGGGPNPEGRIEAMYVDESDNSLYIAGDFYEMDGIGCASVMRWDGTSWTPFGANIFGTVYAIEKLNDKIYVGGDFIMATGADYRNLAVMNNGYWQGMQMGDMEGSIRSLKGYGGLLYIGGDFQKVNGQSMAHWAALVSDTWQYSNFGNIVTGPVQEMIVVDEELVVAGDFQIIGTSSGTFGANYLAKWNGAGWTWFSDGTHGPVSAIHYFDDKLILADTAGVSVRMSSGNWADSEEFLTWEQPAEQPRIFQIIDHNNEVYAVGDFAFYPFGIGYFAQNMIQLFFSEDPDYVWADGKATFDSTVTSAASYKGKFYTGGLFQNVDSSPYNKLAATDLGLSTSIIDPGQDAGLNVYFAPLSRKLVIEANKAFSASADVVLFDMLGRKTGEIRLPPNASKFELDVQNYHAGAYVYSIRDGDRIWSGKFLVRD